MWTLSIRFGRRYVVPVALSAAVAGCSYYQTPGSGADVRGLFPPAVQQATEPNIAAMLAVKPVAPFPANVAVVRVQAPEYRAYETYTHGGGRFTMVSANELQTKDRLTKLAAMPHICDVALVGALLLPNELDSDQPLREAAARLHADLLLIYTLDTKLYEKNPNDPLDLVTLGLFPTKHVQIDCTASAVLMDTRTGYVYGLAEAASHEGKLANPWTSDEAADQARRRAESGAMDDLLIELDKLWGGIVAAYGPGGPAARLAKESAATQPAALAPPP